MSTSPVKRFLSLGCCLCCGNKEKSEKISTQKEINGNSVQTNYKDLQNKESFGEKDENKNRKTPAGGIPNLAFTKEEDVPEVQAKILTTQPVKQSQPQPKMFRDRQISDISAFFAVGSDEQDLDLTDMVMEEINKSMPVAAADKTEDSKGEEDEEEDNEDVFSPVTNDDDSVHSDLIQDSNERIRESFEFAEKKDKVKNIEDEEYVPPQDKESHEPPVIQEISQPPQQRSTEWRDKLIENLMNDDLEFELSESESETDDKSVDSVSISSSDDEKDIIQPPAIDKTKGSESATNDIKPQATKSYKTPIVLDNGSYEIKLGFAGEYTPEHKIRTIVGRWRSQCSEAWKETYGEILIGDDAMLRHAALSIQYPHKDGAVTNWKDMSHLWEKSMSRFMEVEPKEHPLLLTESMCGGKSQREKSVEVAIEKLYCPLVTLQSQAAMTALSTGADVALVVNSGYGHTEVVPVYCGSALTHASYKVNVGGRHITEYLARLIKKESGHTFESFSEVEVLRKIKEQHATMNNDDNSPRSRKQKNSLSHELPDGQVIELKNELSSCGEPLFQPDLIGLEGNRGLDNLIKDSINSLDPEIKPEMCSSILLSGGTSRMSGFKDRISREMKQLDTEMDTKSVVTLANANSAWIGGSLLANQENFNSNCISDDLYFEFGPNIVHRMCF